MKGTQYLTKEAILKRAQEVIGIPLREIDATGRLKTGKGAIGTVIEESWYGYKPNSESEPDFPEAGVELKVTPYLKKKRKGITAKERLVCNIINYMEEYDKTFHTSSFWHKCNTMLLMSYEHLKNKPKGDFRIDKAILFSFPEEDLVIIERDWQHIIEKIRAGKAHELSEGDTLYLGACTKGNTAADVRQQPFSDIPAKKRAYSLKASYMTQILKKYIFGNEKSEKIIKDWHDLQECTFEEYVIQKVRPFYGMTQDELQDHFNFHSKAKNLNDLLLTRMLGVKGRLSNAEEFKKAGIKPRTLQVNKRGTLKQSFPFPHFDFIELSKEEIWEDSELYNQLAPIKFLFAIFKERADGQYVFERVMLWNMPHRDLEEVRKIWEKTVHIIREGVVLEQTSNGVKNNLPKMKDNNVAHVRPHATKGAMLPLPDGRMMTKQSFWLKNSYIKTVINSDSSV